MPRMPSTSALLYVSPERVLYRGALGKPRKRKLAASAWYLPVGGELNVTGPDGDVLRGAVSVFVPAGMPHQVEAAPGQVVCFLAEVEFEQGPGGGGTCMSSRQLSHAEVAELASLDARLLLAWRGERRRIDAELDRLVLGQVLVRREVEGRIADVVQRVRLAPALAWQAAEAAAHCGLSPSRFLHLFKAELGMGWRDFRAWTRARALLACVQDGDNLTQVALSLGYPDGTHFSHAIRQITGLRPRDIIAGSRDLTVWRESGVSPA